MDSVIAFVFMLPVRAMAAVMLFAFVVLFSWVETVLGKSFAYERWYNSIRDPLQEVVNMRPSGKEKAPSTIVVPSGMDSRDLVELMRKQLPPDRRHLVQFIELGDPPAETAEASAD